MAQEAHTAEAAQMASMPPMLAYTIRSPIQTGSQPWIRVGQGNSAQVVTPNQTPPDNSYWIVILDANKPATKVKDWVVSGMNNTTLPGDLPQYMNNPGYHLCRGDADPSQLLGATRGFLRLPGDARRRA